MEDGSFARLNAFSLIVGIIFALICGGVALCRKCHNYLYRKRYGKESDKVDDMYYKAFSFLVEKAFPTFCITMFMLYTSYFAYVFFILKMN